MQGLLMSDVATESYIIPRWPAPSQVKAISTTRLHGYSRGAYSSNNLATHVGDEPETVMKNRRKLQRDAQLPGEPLWLNQVHGNRVIHTERSQTLAEADAAISQQPEQICVVMTADCLPVLFSSKDGAQIAAAHAGWRGLLNGILENTIAEFSQNSNEILAWFGPAIGADYFEVGEEVVSAFVEKHKAAELAFRPAQQQKKWLADI